MEPKLTNTASLKTYSRSKCWKVSNPKDVKSEPLTTKEAVKYLLQGSLKRRVCRFCLTATTSLSELDEILDVASSGAIFQVTIRDMVASFYPFQVSDDPNFPNKICGKCLDRTINCYLFTQQCERAERAIRNCFVDISEKFDKLDPLERVKRRGRQKQNPNHNIIHVEHKNVIDYADPIINIINSGSTLISNNNDVQINELECPKCWQVFTNVESLVNHEKIHPKSMWYNCKFCGNSFVKHSHYKKHIKQFHGKDNTKPNTDKTLQCKECGTVCEELENYLQHIEKHKFKNVLEHLVEKKMDSLCGVCLDKGDSMTRLNETLFLHGGYPELSGELTVATVLTSTIPEKSHKYGEFLVSKEANRVAITKRITKTGDKTNNNHDVNKATNAGDVAMTSTITCDTYCFSNPLKISNETVDIDEINSSTFEKAKYVDISSLYIGIRGKSKDRLGFKFTFSNPLNICNEIIEIKDREEQIDMTANDTVKHTEDIQTEPNRGTSKPPILCMTCSILKKAQCDKCIDIINNEGTKNTNGKNERSQKPCKMCWIFGKVGKCTYCKDQIGDNNTVRIKDISKPQEPEIDIMIPKENIDLGKVDVPKENIEEDIPNQRDLELEKEISTTKVIVESEKENNTRKRKTESEEVIIPKKNPEQKVIVDKQYVESDIIPKPKENLEPEEIITTRKGKIESEEFPIEVNAEPENPVQSRKRKIDHESEVPFVKRSKWQCEICLTNNDNRERCFCCGEKKVQDNATNFSFNLTKCEYTPKRNKNKSEAVKNNNYIITNNNGDNEKTEQIILKEDKQEENKVEIIKSDLLPNISVPNTEAVVADVIKEDTSQIKLLNEEQMDVNFDDGNAGKIVGNVPKFDGNIVKFDANIGKLDANVVKFDNIIGNFGKIDSSPVKPVMPTMNFNFGATTFTPMQSFTPPVIQNFNPIAMSPTQLSSLSFNIGTQDSKPRKILKNMRHRRERQVKK